MRLFLFMVIVTTVEVMLIAKVGTLIGFWATFALILITALIGSSLLKRQWRFVMGKLQTLQSEPSQALLEALILVICGVLLITPGFLTDSIGFLGLIPTVRERFVGIMRRYSGQLMTSRFQIYSNQTHQTSSNHSPFGRSAPNARHQQNDAKIIEGQFERKDGNE